jgi:endoglucanase
VDPGHSDLGWPTDATRDEWRLLADRFADTPHVLFGLVNEPQYNFDGSQDADVWAAMNDTVQVIRDVEDFAGGRHHVITVQGTGAWARRLSYYVDHPITAGGGEAIAYEVHVYDPADQFAVRFEDPSATLPVVIGEFGPTDLGPMTEDDCRTLMQSARSLEIPHLAWTFHMRCPPNLLVDNSEGGCGEGMALEPTPWGTILMEGLAAPW